MAHQQLEKTNGFRWFLVLQTWEVATLCLNLWRPMHECHFSSKRSESVGSLSSCFWAGFRIMFQLGIILELDAILWPVVQIKIAEAQLITAAIVANATQSLDIWPSPRGLKSSLKKNCANTITTDWAVNQSIHKQQLQVRCGNCLSKYLLFDLCHPTAEAQPLVLQQFKVLLQHRHVQRKLRCYRFQSDRFWSLEPKTPNFNLEAELEQRKTQKHHQP